MVAVAAQLQHLRLLGVASASEGSARKRRDFLFLQLTSGKAYANSTGGVGVACCHSESASLAQPFQDQQETQFDPAPKCGTKPEGGLHAILQNPRRVLEVEESRDVGFQQIFVFLGMSQSQFPEFQGQCDFLLLCSLVGEEVDVSLSEPQGLRAGEGWFAKGNCYQKKGDWVTGSAQGYFLRENLIDQVTYYNFHNTKEHLACVPVRINFMGRAGVPESGNNETGGLGVRCQILFGYPHQFLSPNRKQKKNHTSKLHELALLLPVAPRTSSKKLTKKEVLLHVLHYIQYLQRNIDVAKALLAFHTATGEGEVKGWGRNPTAGSARRRHLTPSSSPHSCKSCVRGACQKPRKKKLTRATERQTRTQNPRRCLALDKPKKQVAPSADQKGRNVEGTTAPPRCADSYTHPAAALSLPQGDRKGSRSWLTLLAVAKDRVCGGISRCSCKNSAQDDGPYLAFGAQQGAERTYLVNGTQSYPRQKLAFYESSEEVDKEAPDADPWLPVWTPEGISLGSPLALGPPQIDNRSATGPLSEILGLSPSLFSSPGKGLPAETLEDSSLYLTQALFEEIFLDAVSSPSGCVLEVPQKEDSPREASKDLPDSCSLCQCLGSLSEDSSGSEDSVTDDTDAEVMWAQQDTPAGPEGPRSVSDEDGDYTWTPSRQVLILPSARRKARKGLAGTGPVKPKIKKAPCSTQTKKKCVNGFIMFCRMNRKQYIRACPGTASTAATKELAQLWREMTEQERKPYCIKARRFSRQHNRIVKKESSSSDDEDWGVPKPFYQLLADRARSASGPAAQLPSQRE
ncbi:meiosis initiator protein [Desmodus rotundus]|uniref:meiosis initiator protein n=1 Tax=Desmodus rotundus TaxID=9430 RepID=UPI0023815109|nr:meiosis initiator protein [Desmodus rotundus]